MPIFSFSCNYCEQVYKTYEEAEKCECGHIVLQEQFAKANTKCFYYRDSVFPYKVEVYGKDGELVVYRREED